MEDSILFASLRTTPLEEVLKTL